MMANKIKTLLVLEPQEYEVSHLELVKDSQDINLSVLKRFDSHSLAQQNMAALMNRIDSKFLLPIDAFEPFMNAISDDYSILSSLGRKIFSYQTTYFDNKDRQFYLDHHNGKLNRYKVRFRRYVESNMGYMEIKFKNNKKRTIKQRTPMNCILPDQRRVNDFVQNTLGYSAKLETALFVNYQRITLINKKSLERITIDLNLSFQNSKNDSQNDAKNNAKNKVQSIQNNVFIVEVKQVRKPLDSACRRFMKQHNHKEINFSKYCIGSLLTTEDQSNSEPLKANNFKHILRKLNDLNRQH